MSGQRRFPAQKLRQNSVSSRLWASFVMLAIATIAFVNVGCDTDSTAPRGSALLDGRINISNDVADLSTRLDRGSADIGIDPPADGRAYRGRPAEFSLTLVAEVASPTVDGQVLQATAVALEGANRAVVSYCMIGEPRLGAVDLITHIKQQPSVSASATFTDSDFYGIAWDGDYVYAAGSTGAEGFDYPAVCERLLVEDNEFSLRGNKRVPLVSYAGTSSALTDDELYTTAGNGGGVYAYDRDHLRLLAQYELDEARWVTWDRDGERVIVVQGMPGRVSVFEEGVFPGGSMRLLATYPFPGADVAESKSMAVVEGDFLFIAAGPAGVQIMNLDDGSIVGSIPIPDPASLGLDPSVVTTNAVAIDDDLMFISNGEAGVWVAQASDDFEEFENGQVPDITMIGHLRFDNLQSANHVEFKNDLLVVAAGIGGVKVVEVDGD